MIRTLLIGSRGLLGGAIGEALIQDEGVDLVGTPTRSETLEVLNCGGPFDALVDASTPEAAVDHASLALNRGVKSILLAATRASLQDRYLELGEEARRIGSAVVVASNLSAGAASLEAAINAFGVADIVLTDFAGPNVPQPLQTTKHLARIAQIAGSRVSIGSVRDVSNFSRIHVVCTRGDEELTLDHEVKDPSAWGTLVPRALWGMRQLSGVHFGLLTALR